MLYSLGSLDMDQVQAMMVLFLVGLSGLVILAELVLRFIPTSKEDGALKRLGDRIDRLLDMLHVPNKTKPKDTDGDKNA